MSDVSEHERNEFFKRLGYRDGKPFVEQREGGPIVSLDGRPPGWRAEYRSAHRALPPLPPGRSPEEYERRFERLMVWCRETDKLEAH